MAGAGEKKALGNDSTFRKWITADGSSEYKAEAGRYHLYVSWACPFAHRAIIARKLKGLEDAISMSVVDWLMTKEKGWAFNPQRPGCTEDEVNHKSHLREVYQMVEPGYSGRVTVPLLWDKKTQTIVNNESAEILRMLNEEFNEFCRTKEQRALVLYPKELRSQIDKVNEWVHPNINLGVYKAGFATKQEDYDAAVKTVFENLDKAEGILSTQRYLCGSQFTEADIRLFTSLVRFDTVYHTHFKCNRKLVTEYPSLWGFVRDIYQMEGVGETVKMDHIANHYYQSHLHINPNGIVPIGPELDFKQPHNRENLGN